MTSLNRKSLTLRLLVCAALVFYGFTTALSDEQPARKTAANAFRAFDASSTLTINYDALTLWLQATVVDIGRSDRRNAPMNKPSIGTRIAPKVRRATIYEGNRFYFEAFEDNDMAQKMLKGIRTSLEQIPSLSPLEDYSREEQLAYWLNLYNVTMLNEVVAIYPKRKLKKLLVGKDSVLSQKLLNVDGVELSLNDIQYEILGPNYDYDPLIMYGLYQGIIGGPNIRRSAYTGENVYKALGDNAAEFINSNRGTAREKSRGNVLEVSSLYERNQDYFPEFNEDLSTHLLSYLEGEHIAMVDSETTLKPAVDDWVVNDLYGTYPEIRTGVATNPAALLGSYRSTTPADPAYGPGGVTGAALGSAIDSNMARQVHNREVVFDYLLVLNMKRLATNEKNATVTIEDLEDDDAEANPNGGDEQ